MYKVVISSSANYIIIFRVVEKAKEVRVVHFFHETQDYLSLMKNEL